MFLFCNNSSCHHCDDSYCALLDNSVDGELHVLIEVALVFFDKTVCD